MSSPSIPSPFTINVPDAVLRDLAADVGISPGTGSGTATASIRS
jgi:hypothetical protein